MINYFLHWGGYRGHHQPFNRLTATADFGGRKGNMAILDALL